LVLVQSALQATGRTWRDGSERQGTFGGQVKACGRNGPEVDHANMEYDDDNLDRYLYIVRILHGRSAR